MIFEDRLIYLNVDFYKDVKSIMLTRSSVGNILLFVDENEITTFPMTGYRFDKYYRKTLIDLFGEQK